MLNIIKQAALGAVDTSNPVAILFGEINKTSPLEVNVDQRFALTEDFFIVLDQAKELSVGDRIALLRVQGGHSYVILGKVV
ncbi:DUF2577 domain-containing protein [Paenibacillus larvae]|uniref:DUF2577 domain-containing protein n=5 Tax=Paenibacillus larvae TaxID=1464 RepID=A0A6C0QRG7_9BACL|nr:DUF2577 domain-containing protein [Paenibacillus larvae]AQR77431.1 hypothetical protein BXP28_08805 [Paenibacillus larvae subsp. larvae]AVF21544.1 hypothetical protein ERICI_01666 [Paenibacillus larvae subsp. larvae]ETK30334.1 hypothetical protein ERIC1_1c39010 [Paenibacillus larvae subsp. larvae DSM 25719]MCY7477547.1 DUF2577 domain-containing protein [Paenibacillus larvae]MCY7489519.1 DUF2577 domain-containing protein [Paenibacillus larvae]